MNMIKLENNKKIDITDKTISEVIIESTIPDLYFNEIVDLVIEINNNLKMALNN